MTYLEEVNGRSITVRNVEYTIEVLPSEEIDEITGDKVFGIASDEDSKIYLREGMNDDRAEQVLTHEILHTMFFESGYTFEDEDQEEEITEALSLVMQDMIIAGHLEITLDDPDEEIEIMQPMFMGEPLFKAPQLKKSTDEKTFYYVETPERLFKISSEEYGKLLESTHNFQFFDLLTSSYFDIAISAIDNVSKVKPFKEEK